MQDPKKSPKIAIWAPSHNFVGLYLRNQGTYRQSEKNLLSSNISSRCPHNMVNFGLLAAEIVSSVWGTPANFNGFRILAALLHGTLVVGVSQTAAFNRGRHLYSAGRPSGWALAHILVIFCDPLYFLEWVKAWSGSGLFNLGTPSFLSTEWFRHIRFGTYPGHILHSLLIVTETDM